jgi:hypothetical protein
MIVGRYLYPAKVGKTHEVVEVVADLLDRGLASGRLYVSEIGQLGTVALDLEVESYAEFEKGNKEWLAGPERKAFAQKLYPLLRSPIVLEFWRRER